MKRRIPLTIAFALSIVLASLMTSDSAAKAQRPQRFKFDTGLINPGPDQIVRVTAAGDFDGDGDVDGADFVVFKAIGYTQGVCNTNGVCKHTVASQTTSNPIPLAPGEAASFDIPASFTGGVFVGVRGVVLSNDRDVRVNVMIIDGATGQVDSVLIALLVP